MRRKWVAILAFALLPSVANANTPTITEIDVRIFEGALQEGWFRPSFLGINIPKEGSSSTDQHLCLEFGAGDCGFGFERNFNYFGTVVYPPCLVTGSGPCIEKFELRRSASNWEEVEYLRSVNAPTRSAEEKIGFPAAGSMSLWRSKSVLHQGGAGSYAIYVMSEGSANRDGSWTSPGIQARIVPFVESAGSFNEISLGASKSTIFNGVDYGMRITTTGSFAAGSIWSDRSGKGTRAEWSEGVEARLTLRVPSSASGWIGGRLSGVDFELTPISEKLNRLRITGSPISVAEVEVKIPLADVPQKLKQVYPGIDPPVIGAYFSAGSKHAVAARALEALREYTNDKATRTRTVWGFETVDSTANKCLADTNRIVGFVSTNALAYTNSAPTFAEGRLKYAVASMHRNEKGDVIRGSYDLVIRSDAARCLYGFSNAPIEAVVSVTYGDKEQNISTTASGERDGWLFISAKNFTFSNPTIEVAISQPKPTPTASATPTPTPTVVATPNKVTKPSSRKTISCVKGTTVKKITGKSPRCPKGFKKRV